MAFWSMFLALGSFLPALCGKTLGQRLFWALAGIIVGVPTPMANTTMASHRGFAGDLRVWGAVCAWVMTVTGVAWGASRLQRETDPTFHTTLMWLFFTAALLLLAIFFGLELIPWLKLRQPLDVFLAVMLLVLASLLPVVTMSPRAVGVVLGAIALANGHALFALVRHAHQAGDQKV